MGQATRALVCIVMFGASSATAQQTTRRAFTMGDVALLANQSPKEIAPSGCIDSARVVRSIPALDLAALRAVLEWKYDPILLDGHPVRVLMTMTVNFTLQ
jgi:TonB family protein